jgi:YcxB-like protein
MSEPMASAAPSATPADAAEPAACFELRYRIEPKDFLALVKHVRPTRVERFYSILPPLAVGMLGGVVGLLGYIAIDILSPSLSNSWVGFVPFVLCGLAAYLLFRFHLVPAFVRSLLSGQPVGMGETAMVADEHGMRQTCVDIVTGIKWPSVVAIGDTKDHVVLMISRSNGIIVPKRAFEDADCAEDFANFVRSKTVSVA